MLCIGTEDSCITFCNELEVCLGALGFVTVQGDVGSCSDGERVQTNNNFQVTVNTEHHYIVYNEMEMCLDTLVYRLGTMLRSGVICVCWSPCQGVMLVQDWQLV